ncbi:D-3-phosphoglycerate dehydrogenase [Orenia metallireducens]|uniref:D-3-phosphoglycerate dehydrogenase n=1 Tax=Orenia metallireducens TaxID=1413210 RepID=A0A285GY64_9FIRM|nr:phosphoglycerate dehydrogenase [Orenia metallireducens]PRX26423.1 D-3-phosphoglycerate dehydrogenase [Orenia metallireducens]SNY28519.1 D-3-phosphoglycerate dehydrogenase [Orenia metallireducens]
MKVLVSDVISQKGIDVLEENGAEVTYNTQLSYEELLEEIGKYDGIILRSMTPLNEEVLSHAKNLKVIARAGSGYDNIDVDAASKLGIIVLNTPGQNSISAAEQTMALMLAISRNTAQANQSLHQGVWDRKKYMGVELYEKTLGIIGLGRIGGLVSQRAKAFDMNIIASDPYIPASRGEKLGVELVELDELLERSDYITLHTPLTEETHHILSTEEFAKMKDGVRVVNVARGKNVDHKALYEAIKNGKVAAAGIDVHEEEPLAEDYLLLQLEENVIVAPHLGGTTVEAMDNVSIDAARQMLMVFEKGFAKTPLNIPTLEPEEMNQIRPYFNLAEKLGNFYAGLTDNRIEEVEVIYTGEITNYDLQPVTTTLLKGLLNPILDDNVNLVNARLLAEERGIKVSEIKNDDTNVYSSLITLKVKNSQGVRQLSGTVFNKSELRVVEIDGYEIDIVPKGILLVTSHTDQPGVVGKVGSLLGDNGVNIASLKLGRNKIGGKAIMVLNIDQEIDNDLKEELLEIDGMADVNVLTL